MSTPPSRWTAPTHPYTKIPLTLLTGVGRSGTTALRESLGQHPDLHSTERENNIIYDIIDAAQRNASVSSRRYAMRVTEPEFAAAGECTMTACTVRGGGVGINAGNGSTITGCTANSSNGNGFGSGESCTFANCTAYNNTGGGFSTGFACTIASCSATSNNSVGILAGTGSTVADCTSRDNALDGIRCSSACLIRGNTCSTNGNGGFGAGILVINSQNRIEGNTCTGADRGIQVMGAGNIIIRNTCSGNTSTNWTMDANNIVGPIIDRTVPASNLVSGNSAPDSTGTTHPNANFTY